MSDDDLIKGIIAVGLGILGGVALVEVLRRLSQKECPYCNKLNDPNQEFCDNCGGYLE